VTLLEAVRIALPIIESRTKSITVDAALKQFWFIREVDAEMGLKW
jgi:hypothetical protein